MARHDDHYKGFRFIVDTLDAERGRFVYQAVVDGKRPLTHGPFASHEAALEAGISAAKAKIDEVLAGYQKR